MTHIVYFAYGDDEDSFHMQAVPRVGETLEFHREPDDAGDDWIWSKHDRWRVDSVHHFVREHCHQITCYLSKA